MQSAILLTYLDPHFFEMPIIINIFILKFAQDSMAKSKIENRIVHTKNVIHSFTRDSMCIIIKVIYLELLNNRQTDHTVVSVVMISNSRIQEQDLIYGEISSRVLAGSKYF